MHALPKLIDYFVVVGLNDKITQCHFDFNEEEKLVTNVQLFIGYISKDSDVLLNENEKWIDLDGYQTVWLKLSFNQTSSTPITNLDFLCIPFEDHKLKTNSFDDYLPIPIQKLNAKQDQDKEFQNMFLRDFDLTEILGFERVPGMAIVLCYKRLNTQDYHAPLEDVALVIGERKREINGITKNIINLTSGYESVKRFFVNKDKTFNCLTFKKTQDFLKKTFVPEVIDRYPQAFMQDTQAIVENIQLFCFPEGISLSRQIREPHSFSFILTKESGERVYGTTLVFDEDFPLELKDQLGYGPINKENPLFTQKAICLLSHYPFLSEFTEILKQIYRIHLSKNDVPLERVICNLVDETPLPVKGKQGVLVDYGKPIFFARSLHYPIVPERAIHNLFKIFNSYKIIELVKMILLEKKILLISKYKSLLTDAAEALTGFIYPFTWVRPLIPILPAAWRDYLECPTPFLIGLNVESHVEQNMDIANDVVKVYLDKGEIYCEEKLPQLPEKYYKTLVRRLEVFDTWHHMHRGEVFNYDSAFEMQNLPSDIETLELDTYEIQDAFFELVGSLIKHYLKFFISFKENKNGIADLKEMFDITEFLKRKKANKEGAFLYHLIHETSFFSNFIQSRFGKHDIDFQFIDKCIKKKRTKKESRYINKPEMEKTFKTFSPNNQNIDKKTYIYQSFPRFNHELFVESRLVSKEAPDSAIKSLSIEAGQLSLIDESKWAKFLLESIYTVWFLVFNLKIKNGLKDYYNKVAEYAINLFEDAQNRGVKPNETMYRNLLEALCLCGMEDKALELANKLKASKNEISHLAFGICMDIVGETKRFKTQARKHSVASPKNETSEIVSPNLNRCINILTHENCPECTQQLYAEDIISGWKKSYNEYTTRCPCCGKNFVATFKIIEQFETQKTENLIHFFSPLIVKKEIENLLRIKGPQILSSGEFEKNHKIIFWNLYLYFSLIKAPTFLIEHDLPKNQVLNDLKSLEDQLQNSQEKKQTWNISFFSTFKSKNVNVKEDVSQIGNDKQHMSKINESTKVSSNESMRVSMAADLPEVSSHIRKTFSTLLVDLRKECDRKVEEYEFEIKFKKEEESPGTSAFIEDLTVIRKSAESINVD